MNSLENYDCIPCINYLPLQSFGDGTLIRYRGMIQDMLNPEFYAPTYSILNTQDNKTYQRSGKFRDIPSCKVISI